MDINFHTFKLKKDNPLCDSDAVVSLVSIFYLKCLLTFYVELWRLVKWQHMNHIQRLFLFSLKVSAVYWANPSSKRVNTFSFTCNGLGAEHIYLLIKWNRLIEDFILPLSFSFWRIIILSFSRLLCSYNTTNCQN